MQLPSKTHVAILGTGTAALAAAKEVSRYTNDFVIISNGVYGTTCGRVGCMPSKVLIQGAELFYSRMRMAPFGITGVESLALDKTALLQHVRQLRDRFVEHTLKETERYSAHIVEGAARFLSPVTFEIEGRRCTAKRVILSTGSSPVMPEVSKFNVKKMLNSDTLFEETRLPEAMTVAGLGPLGLEMAMALCRMGIRIDACHAGDRIGGLSDPVVHACALEIFEKEMKISLNRPVEEHLKNHPGVDTLFVALSRTPNLASMGLEECGVITHEKGRINVAYNPHTMQIGALPVFLAGDAKSGSSVLHDAADEGKIAGYNAAHSRPKSFKRRTKLRIVFTNPAIAVAGLGYRELDLKKTRIGQAGFEDQGRAKIMGLAQGIIRIYAERESQIIIGTEMCAPQAEHLAHLVTAFIDRKLTVKQALALPFYHPTLEEGLRTALKNV